MNKGVNIYFNQTTNIREQNLIEDLIIESIQIHGVNCFYIPRTLVNEDSLYGEDTLSKFTYSTPIEMYLETINGFAGDGDFIAKFGLEIRDSISLTVSKKRFIETMDECAYHDIDKPREGDLIYFPISKGLFEITFVEHEIPQFYQHGKLYVFTIKAELFRYSQEDMTTGIPDVDNKIKSLANVDNPINDLFADNANIEADATDGIVNFSETDPFSDGNY